jgi:hypothetical protein
MSGGRKSKSGAADRRFRAARPFRSPSRDAVQSRCGEIADGVQDANNFQKFSVRAVNQNVNGYRWTVQNWTRREVICLRALPLWGS